MKKIRKAMTAVMAMILALALTACSSGSSTESSSTSSGTESSTQSSAVSESSETSETSAVSTEGLRAPKNGKQYKVGVILMIENGAFTDMRDGFEQEMRDKGFTEDQMTFDYKCAQGDATNLQTIAQSMSDGSYDFVCTVATPPTQAMVNLGSDTPVIFVAVSAPVAAGVITDMDKPDKNATGTSNAIPMEQIFGLSQKYTPDAKKFGFLYCTSEVNSVNTVNEAKKYCDANGLTYVEKTVTNSSEVQQAAQSLAGSVDALFIPNDSVVQSAMSLVSQVARDAKIPIYASSATTVASGAFATVAISDTGIGRISADKAIQYLQGTDIADIPAEVVPADQTVINEDTMKALGLEVTDSDVTFVKESQ